MQCDENVYVCRLTAEPRKIVKIATVAVNVRMLIFVAVCFNETSG